MRRVKWQRIEALRCAEFEPNVAKSTKIYMYVYKYLYMRVHIHTRAHIYI